MFVWKRGWITAHWKPFFLNIDGACRLRWRQSIESGATGERPIKTSALLWSRELDASSTRGKVAGPIGANSTAWLPSSLRFPRRLRLTCARRVRPQRRSTLKWKAKTLITVDLTDSRARSREQSHFFARVSFRFSVCLILFFFFFSLIRLARVQDRARCFAGARNGRLELGEPQVEQRHAVEAARPEPGDRRRSAADHHVEEARGVDGLFH